MRWSEWDEQVFLEAAYFKVVRFIGRGQFERCEFPIAQFPKALEFARQPQTGRPRMIYAVNEAGRQVCLEAARDEFWLATWHASGML